VSIQLGAIVPDFSAETTMGAISFHEWLGSSWGVLFSHPRDFTPVCTTELGELSRLKMEFDRRDVKVIGLSVDSVDDHRRWAEDIKLVSGAAPNFPMIGDPDRRIATLYGMLPADAPDTMTVRAVFVVGSDKRLKLSITYPASTGRNFFELLRAIDSLQLTAKHQVATPVNWTPGESVIIVPSLSDDQARERFPKGWRALTPYLRVVPQPPIAYRD
jgi:alkyl hydroperoxide reductase subunit AhpC